MFRVNSVKRRVSVQAGTTNHVDLDFHEIYKQANKNEADSSQLAANRKRFESLAKSFLLFSHTTPRNWLKAPHIEENSTCRKLEEVFYPTPNKRNLISKTYFILLLMSAPVAVRTRKNPERACAVAAVDEGKDVWGLKYATAFGKKKDHKTSSPFPFARHQHTSNSI
jgi:hypothetical protein